MEKVELGNGRAVLYCGDCREVLTLIEAGSVAAVITDPPYNATDLDFDKIEEYGWILESRRIVSPYGYLASFGMFWLFAEIAKHWRFRFDGVWDKITSAPRTHSAKMPRNQQEKYAVFCQMDAEIKDLTWNKILVPGEPYRREYRKNKYKRGGKDQLSRSSNNAWTEDGYILERDTRNQTDVIVAGSKQLMPLWERTDHPTQKPVHVFGTLVRWLTNPGDTILDPYFGSCSSGVAAIRCGRRFVGVEIDPGYFAIAVKRIESELDNPPLFPSCPLP